MIDRLAPTRRPGSARAGAQKWRSLLFVHWEVPVAAVRPLIPARLAIDTFEGRAFVGLVPFTMCGVRPWWAPPVAGISAFHETNVRTYVHLDGAEPGVWFFSLDAASTLAVHLARTFWRLPYFRARMTMQVDGKNVGYRSDRFWPKPVPASLDAQWTVGEPLGTAAPGSLEHFLVERYVLYTERDAGQLLRGRVHHTPYPLANARLERLEESLLIATGIARPTDPVSVLYSSGVDVDVFALEPA